LKTLQQSDMRAQRVWISGSTAEILSILRARKMTGEQLRNLRDALGLTQQQLADVLGVTVITIIRSEKGQPSEMVQKYLDLALRRGDLGIAIEHEPLSETVEKSIYAVRRNRERDISVVSEPHAEYGKKPAKEPTKKPRKKRP
jgi:transcriptional regulator with XRE-family HTH domain